MLSALATLTDRVVVALIDKVVIPDPPDGCEYLEIGQAVYDEINAEIIDRYRCLKWRLVDDGAGAFVQVENLREKAFYAICNTGDRAIVSLDTAIADFTRPGTEVVEISQEDFLTMKSNPTTHDADSLVPAWDCAIDGTVTARPDTRPVLHVTQTGDAVAGNPLPPITFELKDSGGIPIPVTASRQILITSISGQKLTRLSLTNGVKVVTPTLEAGSYEIATADSAAYRVAGDTKLDVAEAWA